MLLPSCVHYLYVLNCNDDFPREGPEDASDNEV